MSMNRVQWLRGPSVVPVTPENPAGVSIGAGVGVGGGLGSTEGAWVATGVCDEGVGVGVLTGVGWGLGAGARAKGGDARVVFVGEGTGGRISAGLGEEISSRGGGLESQGGMFPGGQEQVRPGLPWIRCHFAWMGQVRRHLHLGTEVFCRRTHMFRFDPARRSAFPQRSSEIYYQIKQLFLPIISSSFIFRLACFQSKYNYLN